MAPRAVAAALASRDEAVCIVADGISAGDMDGGMIAAEIAAGARLRAYRFDKYRTTQKEDEKPRLRSIAVATADPKAAEAAFEPLDKVVDGVYFTRDLVTEPANVMTPRAFVEQLKDLAGLGIDVEILDRDRMAELGMNALLGVAQGSANEPYLAIMRWAGAEDDTAAPVAFVGKGVCFDSGGISIKPAQGMELMKWDMGGAAVVSGLMKALAGRKAAVNAIGVVGLVENMPSATAQRPGDVVKSLSGQTIEVINTDAEGRLVLADALTYTIDRFKPREIIDLATLTGAIMVALGSYRAGLFSNDDGLSESISQAGDAVGEQVWRMPLGDRYDKDISSDIADMKNVGKGREAGSITAAQFLQRFVKDTPWAHLDIAGVTWTKENDTLVPKGGTGFGVRLLDRVVRERYEGK